MTTTDPFGARPVAGGHTVTPSLGIAGNGVHDAAPPSDLEYRDELPFVVANEFAEVCVRRVLTHNGVRLEVSSPRLRRSVRLDPLQLEALTWQDSASFSAMLAEPFGPAGGGARATGDADPLALGRQTWANGNGCQ